MKQRVEIKAGSVGLFLARSLSERKKYFLSLSSFKRLKKIFSGLATFANRYLNDAIEKASGITAK
jgi:hypothetical protein